MGFFKAIGGFFKRVFTSAPSWTLTASGVIKLVLPLAQTVVTLLVGKDAGSEAVNIGNEVVSDLGLVGGLLSQMHANPSDASAVAQIQQALNGASNNLNALLQAGHIKDPDTLSKVQLVSQTILGEISAILSVLPTSVQPPA